jgi:hypothetical protein
MNLFIALVILGAGILAAIILCRLWWLPRWWPALDDLLDIRAAFKREISHHAGVMSFSREGWHRERLREATMEVELARRLGKTDLGNRADGGVKSDSLGGAS